MKLTIEIKTTGPAFEEHQGMEVGSILENLADEFYDIADVEYVNFPIYDSEGDPVGWVSAETEEEEDATT